MMPGMGGSGLIATLRRTDPAVKIVVFSGLIENFDMARFGAGEGLERVTKPFNAEQLLGAIDRVLNSSVQQADGAQETERS